MCLWYLFPRWTIIKIDVKIRKFTFLENLRLSFSFIFQDGAKGQRNPLSQRLTQGGRRDGISTSQGYYLWFIPTTAARAKICRVVPMVYYFIRGHSSKMFAALFPNKWIQPWHSAGIGRTKLEHLDRVLGAERTTRVGSTLSQALPDILAEETKLFSYKCYRWFLEQQLGFMN